MGTQDRPAPRPDRDYPPASVVLRLVRLRTVQPNRVALGLVRRVRPHIIHAHLHEGALIGSVLSRVWKVPMVFDYLKDGAFAAPKIVEDSADVMITELGRWAAALKPLRG